MGRSSSSRCSYSDSSSIILVRQFVLPFALNQSGSVVYVYLLGSAGTYVQACTTLIIHGEAMIEIMSDVVGIDDVT